MIEVLSIKRFKSIKELELPCRKVNLFIGPPDAGKTNILEALSILGALGWNQPIGGQLRLRQEVGFDALFFRQFFDKQIEIDLTLGAAGQGGFPKGRFEFRAFVQGSDRALHVATTSKTGVIPFGGTLYVPDLAWIRYYVYQSSDVWTYESGQRLGDQVILPPSGSNLMYIARHNSEVYEYLKQIVAALDWKVSFDTNLRRFTLSEVREDEILHYNLDLLSDSIKRQFFYGSIILSSADATLVFDEPDVFAFPPYPKLLGEMIGTDQTNQYFLTTHNPYFLAGVVGKTPASALAVYVCQRQKDGSTAAKLLSDDDVAALMALDASAFFNLDRFLDA